MAPGDSLISPKATLTSVTKVSSLLYPLPKRIFSIQAENSLPFFAYLVERRFRPGDEHEVVENIGPNARAWRFLHLLDADPGTTGSRPRPL